MDSAFTIPGTNIRMGLDGIIGLVPIAGDLISGLISSYVIWEARRLGASRWVIGRMMTNTLIDTVSAPYRSWATPSTSCSAATSGTWRFSRSISPGRALAVGGADGPIIEGEAIRLP